VRVDTRRIKFDNLNIEAVDPDPDSTPEFRKHTHRPHALVFSPEAVFESAHTSSNLFMSFLFQNYPSYYTEVDELVDVSEYLSLSDCLSSKRGGEEYGTSMGMRGMLYAHTGPIPSMGMRPVVKPEEWAVNKRENENKEEMRSIVEGWTSGREGFGVSAMSQTALVRDVIPFVWFLKREEMGSYDAHWALQMTRFGSGSGRQEYLRDDDECEGIDDGLADLGVLKKRAAVIDASFLEDDIVD
jgi:hypothetical protein